MFCDFRSFFVFVFVYDLVLILILILFLIRDFVVVVLLESIHVCLLFLLNLTVFFVSFVHSFLLSFFLSLCYIFVLDPPWFISYYSSRQATIYADKRSDVSFFVISLDLLKRIEEPGDLPRIMELIANGPDRDPYDSDWCIYDPHPDTQQEHFWLHMCNSYQPNSINGINELGERVKRWRQ